MHHPRRHGSGAALFRVVLFTYHPRCSQPGPLWPTAVGKWVAWGSGCCAWCCFLHPLLFSLLGIQLPALSLRGSPLSDLSGWGKIILGFPAVLFCNRGFTLRIWGGPLLSLEHTGTVFYLSLCQVTTSRMRLKTHVGVLAHESCPRRTPETLHLSPLGASRLHLTSHGALGASD